MHLWKLAALPLALSSLASGPMPKAEISRARDLERHASELQKTGRYADAEKPLQDAIALWTQYRGEGDIEVLNDTMNLAVAYRRQGDAARAIPILERTKERLFLSKDPDAPELWRKAMNNLAAAYRFADRPKDARATWEALLPVIERTGGPSIAEERARVLDNLAGVLTELGDVRAAEKYAQSGHEAWLALRGEDDVDTAISRSVLGDLATRNGELKEGRVHLESSLRVLQKILGDDHPNVAPVLNLLAVLEFKEGNRKAARADYELSLAISRKKHLDSKHPQVVDAVRGIDILDKAAAQP